jgi:hypothetical protein
MVAVCALAAGIVAAVVVVLSALGPHAPVPSADAAPTSTKHVRRAAPLHRFDELAFRTDGRSIRGTAGPHVVAVIVKLTGKGTKWATLRNGRFHALFPAGRRAVRVIEVRHGGARRVYRLTASSR